jgi:hypothetical protein
MAEDPGWFKEGTAWTFNNGYEFRNKETGQTAKGSVSLAKEDGKDALKLEFDFTEAGAYVLGMSKITNGDCNELRVTVKGDTKANLLIRTEDANGEFHQFKVDYTTPGQPQDLRLNLLKPQQTFGGDDNKVLDLPLKSVNFGATNKGKGLGGELKGTLFFYNLDSLKN